MMEGRTGAFTPNTWLRDIIKRNRAGEAVGTYAVCSAHPAVIEASIWQTLKDGTCLHVESTSNQVNQFGGYTGTTPRQFAEYIRNTAVAAGLAGNCVLLGADHLGPFVWRDEPCARAMTKACELARACVEAGYQKIHLDASMRCADDPAVLEEKVIAERAAMLCRAAEEAFANMPAGYSRPLYVIGTEVPPPGGEVAEGTCPAPTKIEDVHRALSVFHKAFAAQNLSEAWDNVIGLVVQPAVEFGDRTVFDYDREKARSLSAGLPSHPELVYEAHSTDYQTESALREMVADHFAILKVGPWLTFAYREAILALGLVEREMSAGRGTTLSHVREALEDVMLRNPVYWRSYYQGDDEELRFSRAFSFSDRCRYYWPEASVQREVERLLHNLHETPLPVALLSQYLPEEYEAIRRGELGTSAAAVIDYHIRRVLRSYARACGAQQSTT